MVRHPAVRVLVDHDPTDLRRMDLLEKAESPEGDGGGELVDS